MKRILGSMLVLSMLSLGVVGCAEKTEVKKESSVETPSGETSTTTTTETEKSGENPPPAPQ